MKLSKYELEDVVEERTQAVKLRTREVALTHAEQWFRGRSESPTPEQILSLAAKFESYLTAPWTALGKEAAR